MASPAKIVREILVNQRLVVAAAVANRTIPYKQLPGDNTALCYTSTMPDDPDQLVFLRDIPGMVFGKDFRDGKAMEHPGVRVLVRSLTDAGHDLTRNIADTLERTGRITVVVDGTPHYVQSIYRIGTINSMGEETGKKRLLWSINFRVAFQDQET